MLVTEYLYNQNSLPYKASISPQMNASVCMLCMICMILTGLPVERSYDCSSRVFHQPFADLSIGCLEVAISDVRASDIVRLVDNQAKGWRPWPDDDELLSVACSSLFCPQNSFDGFYPSVFYLQSLSANCFSFKLPPELHFAPIFR